MTHARHLLRVAALFVLVIAAFLAARHFLVPPSFGKLGHYRAAAVDDLKRLPVRYAGQAGEASCARCHAAQAKLKAGDGHRGILCETCHGALAAHAAAPKTGKAGKPPEDAMRGFCGRCHGRSEARPKGFPQQDLGEHNPGLACTQCHDPHRPKQ